MKTFATQWWKWFSYYSPKKNVAGKIVRLHRYGLQISGKMYFIDFTAQHFH